MSGIGITPAGIKAPTTYQLGNLGKDIKVPGLTRFPTMTGQQSDFQNQILQYLSSQLGQGVGQSNEAMAAPYKREFNERVVPGLAERFSGLGAGAQNSSAFQNALGSAGAGLEEKLASLNSQNNQQLFQSLLGPGFESSFGYTQEQKPWWQELLGGAAGGIGQGIGSLLPILLKLFV